MVLPVGALLSGDDACAEASALCAATGRVQTARAALSKLSLIWFFIGCSLLCVLFGILGGYGRSREGTQDGEKCFAAYVLSSLPMYEGNTVFSRLGTLPKV